MGEWIKVSDFLPGYAETVLVAVEPSSGAPSKVRHLDIAIFVGDSFYRTGRMKDWRVTHWMKIPELPKDVCDIWVNAMQ